MCFLVTTTYCSCSFHFRTTFNEPQPDTNFFNCKYITNTLYSDSASDKASSTYIRESHHVATFSGTAGKKCVRTDSDSITCTDTTVCQNKRTNGATSTFARISA